MTSEERAKAWMYQKWPPEATADTHVNSLIGEFDAVRAEERARIVSYLLSGPVSSQIEARRVAGGIADETERAARAGDNKPADDTAPFAQEDADRAKAWLASCPIPGWANEWRAVQSLARAFAEARRAK